MKAISKALKGFLHVRMMVTAKYTQVLSVNDSTKVLIQTKYMICDYWFGCS